MDSEGNRLTSPEFTPIGGKSSGVPESNHSFTNMTPILNFSDSHKYTEKINKLRNDNTWTMGVGASRIGSRLGEDATISRRFPGSNNHTLHRTNNFRSGPADSHHNDMDANDINILQSSSVASSMWEEDPAIDVAHEGKTGFRTTGTASQKIPKMSKLFGRDGINRGTNVLPEFVGTKESESLNDDIQADSNMVRLQSDLVKKLQSENTNLRVEILTLRQNLKGLPSDSVNLIEQNVLLNQEIVKLRQELESYRGNADKPIITHGDDERIHELEDDINSYKQQMNTLRDNYQNVLNEKEELLREKFEVENEREKLRGEYEGIREDYLHVLDEKERLANIVESTKQETAELADLKHVKDRLDFLEDEKLRLETENMSLAEQVDQLEEDNTRLSNRMTGLENEIAELEDKLHHNEEINQSNEKVSHMEPNPIIIDDLKDEIVILKDKIGELTKQNETLKENYDADIRNTYHSSRDKVAEMSKSLEEASKTIDILNKELQEKDHNEDLLTKSIKQLNLQIDNYQKRTETLTQQLKQTKSETVNTLTKEIDGLYKQMEEYVAEIEELKDRINEMEKSNAEVQSNGEINDEYVKDLEDDKNELYDHLLKAQTMLKKKEDEIVNLNLEISRLSNAASEVHPDNHDDVKFIKIDDLMTLKDKFEAERKAHEDEIREVVEKSKSSTEKLLTEIDELEGYKSKLIETFEDLQYEYRELEAKYNELLESRDVDDLSNDLAKVSLEYKNSQNEHELLVDNYNHEILVLNKEINLKDMELTRLRKELEIEQENSLKREYSQVSTRSLHEKLTTLEANIKEIKEEKRKLEIEKKGLESNNSQLTIEVGRLRKESEFSKELQIKLTSVENEKSSMSLESKNRLLEIERLKSKLADISKEKAKLEKIIDSLSRDQESILSKSQKISENITKGESSKDLQIQEYERKLSEQKSQYNSMVEEYNYMKNDLIGRMKDMKEEIKNGQKSNSDQVKEWREKFEKAYNKLKIAERYNDALRKEIESLNEELDHERYNINRGGNAIDEEWFPPTPESPGRTQETLNNKIHVLKSQKELILLKLKESSKKTSDLKFMIRYYTLELENKHDNFERSKMLLEQAGIKIDERGSRRDKMVDPLSRLRSLFYVVLASVRFSKRLDEVKQRNASERALKRDIKNSV
jgi:chromosome segregation ATPase